MDQKVKMEKIILSDIFNAIKTLQAGRGETQTMGLANAFIRSMKNEMNCLVLFQNTVQNGKRDKAFLMMRDKDGRTCFPLFTDISKILPIKKKLEPQGHIEIGVMNLKLLIGMLAAKQMCEKIIVNPFLQNFSMPIGFFVEIMNRELVSHITLITADYMNLHADTAVCPTDETISGLNGVDAGILQAGGTEFKNAVVSELQAEGLGIGEVIAVQGRGNLRSRYILFTNMPEYSAQMKVEDVFEYYLNCMNAAKELNSTSIAFPCNHEAMKGMPMEAIIGASTKAVTTWLSSNQDYKIDVYFCCRTQKEKEMYQKFYDGIKK